jgi:ribosomal protein S18 acetylase RimI-like enzyme
MTSQFTFLNKNHFPIVHKTFLEAFSDYQVDMSYMSKDVMFKRITKNGVDFKSSVGVFDGSRMIGFTLIGIDHYKNVLSAFDIGTGIIKNYRGKGIARRMFEFALPRLTELSVKRFILEVIKTNEPAVKAYSEAGFCITRELDCFEFDIKRVNIQEQMDLPLNIKRVDIDILPLFKDSMDWEPSWENNISAIMRIPDDIILYGAWMNGGCVGIIAFCSFLDWIMIFVVKRNYRRRGIGSSLLAYLIQTVIYDKTKIKLLNVDHSDTVMRKFLDKLGFQQYVQQYEMERFI